VNTATRDKVERTRRYLLESDLIEDAKDGLQMLLDSAAEAANGSADRIPAMADAILALSLHEVRQAVRAPEARRDAAREVIEAYLTSDAAQEMIRMVAQKTVRAFVSANPSPVQGRWAGLWALAMRPWPWITISVVAFSPHAPRIVETIVGLAAR